MTTEERLQKAQSLFRQWLELPFVKQEEGWGEVEHELTEGLILGELKTTLGINETFCLGCGRWYIPPGEQCGCFDENGELIVAPRFKKGE